MIGEYDQNKVMLESHSNEYRVRRRPAYSFVTSFLILAKQGAATPFDIFCFLIIYLLRIHILNFFIKKFFILKKIQCNALLFEKVFC